MTAHPRPAPPVLRPAQLFHDRPAQPLLLGFSGGLDSTVLLQLLAADPQVRAHGLRAIHVHHGLQPQADDWARHCEQVAARLGIGCEVARAQVRAAGDGPEAAARAARHRAFAAALRPDEVLVLAQHREDQAETFLLRALRGSGVDGLAAMRRWRRFGDTRLWRPLLDTPRAAVFAHARAHRLDWIDDPSNDDPGFDRNFLRAEVLPLLRRRWPQADASLARAAGLCGEAAHLLAAEDAAALARVGGPAVATLSRPALMALDPQRRARVLRRWIHERGLPPLPAHGVARIEAELLPARADAAACFQWQQATVQAWRDRLHALRVPPAPMPPGLRLEWAGRTPLELPDGGRLALLGAPAFAAPVIVHARRGGERIRLPGRAHTHLLKHVLQAQAVPPWQRTHLPLLSAADGELLAAGDAVVSATLAHWLTRQRARLQWRSPFD